MKLNSVLLTALCAATPLAAMAQPVTGIYVGAGVGANFMPAEHIAGSYVRPSYAAPGPLIFSGPTTSYTTRGTVQVPAFLGIFRDTIQSDVGAVGLGSIGYGLGNGVRVEIEGDYRYNTQNYKGFASGGPSAREQKYGAMANVLFDLDIGNGYIFPYIGAGVGLMHIDRLYDAHVNNLLAYQAIGGVALPIPGVPGLSATLEYRYLGVADHKFDQTFPGYGYVPATRQTTKFLDDNNHSLLVGVRYAFNVAPPPVVAEAVPVARPAVDGAYLVFFDWDRADLTDRARQIIAEAAQATTRAQVTRIHVQGNADRTGTAAYNQRLSLRRAQAVGAELTRNGVPAAAITIEAFGDTKPLIPTAVGVREPQNRRVAIILH